MTSDLSSGGLRSEIGFRRWSICVEAFGFFLEDLPCAVGGAVVDDDDLMRDAAELQLKVQVLDGGRDATLLVTCRNDDGQESEWRVAGHGSRAKKQRAVGKKENGKKRVNSLIQIHQRLEKSGKQDFHASPLSDSDV